MVGSIGENGCFIATMTMSRWRAMPCKGHLERLKRMCRYIQEMDNAFIRVRTGIPDYSSIPIRVYDWPISIYGNVEEELPKNAPKSLGKEVLITRVFFG